MAKKIEWTTSALKDRVSIYNYWLTRNRSAVYGEKLELIFIESVKLISEFPELGVTYKDSPVRSKVVKSYKIFYLPSSEKITVLRIWDTRQEPEK